MEFSMMGSGIYSDSKAVEIDCPGCEQTLIEDIYTDDWGNADQDITCPSCNHEFTFISYREDLD